MNDEKCEWNPERSGPSNTDDVSHADATVSVGSEGQWHLCSMCAALPEFKRFRVRKELIKGRWAVKRETPSR